MATESGFQIGRTAPHFYDLHVGGLMKPFVQALVSATVTPGASVLDVACGTGFATRAAAIAAGAGARVEGCDLNAEMLNQARSTPNPAGSELSWCEASALDLPYEQGAFDVVICQQGLQFFPDPAAGISEMARVARQGGRLGVTVWSRPEQSPFLDLQTNMLARIAGVERPAFSATEEELLEWFGESGLRDVTLERICVDVDLPPVSEFAPLQLKALPWSAGFFDLSAAQQDAAIAELAAGLAAFETDVGITVPFSSSLVTAVV